MMYRSEGDGGEKKVRESKREDIDSKREKRGGGMEGERVLCVCEGEIKTEREEGRVRERPRESKREREIECARVCVGEGEGEEKGWDQPRLP